MNQSDKTLIPHRALAFCIDLALIAAAQLTLGDGTLHLYANLCQTFKSEATLDTTLFLSQFCGGFFFIFYFTFSVGLFGNTVGKKIMRLQVIYEKDGQNHPPTLRQAFYRTLGYLMSSWTYMIGFIIPYFRKDKQALHDLLCGSRVVRKAPSEVLNAQEPGLQRLAPVLPIRTPTMEQAPSQHRSGTDP